MIMEYRGLAWSIVASRSVLEGWCVYWIIGEHHGKSRVSKCIAENDGLPTIRCSVPTRRQTYKHTGIYQSIKQKRRISWPQGLLWKVTAYWSIRQYWGTSRNIDRVAWYMLPGCRGLSGKRKRWNIVKSWSALENRQLDWNTIEDRGM